MTRAIACLTLDVETDHHDLVRQRHTQALDHEPTWKWLTRWSAERGLPWTAFVVGELLESRPDLAERLARTGWELALHSYSHDPKQTDTLAEIQQGKAAFRSAFGVDPRGYRAPLGIISPAGQARLRDAGFQYDSSLFPTVRPGVFNQLTAPLEPHLLHSPDGLSPALVELPCAVVRGVRVIMSVSYMKLLGLPFYRFALPVFGLPHVAVIDCHLHDLAPAPAAVSELPPFWQFVYRRNEGRGQLMLTWLIDWLRNAGYQFMRLDEVALLVRGGHR